MRIIFAGTPDFAADHLQAMLDAGLNIVAVYSQPDRPAGRGKKLQASAVKQLALKNNIVVEQPEKLSSTEAQQTLQNYNADLMVVVAYGLLLPKAVLEIPSYGCINVHGSLLPRWRGAAPIQRSIWAGDKETGVAIMQMDEGLDTGPVLNQASIAIEPEDTSATLYQKLAILGPKALVETILSLDTFTPKAQDDSLATYAKKLSKEEAKVNWEQEVSELERNIRAFNPWPVAWFEYQQQAIKIWKAKIFAEASSAKAGEIIRFDKEGLFVKAGGGVLQIIELQLPNKKRQNVSDIVNGNPELFPKGEILP